MTFPQLQYLLEIHRTGSITQAAKNLFVTQSSVSIALSTLENELGFPIFIRSKKGLNPTPRGAIIIDHAALICESHKLMTSPMELGHTNLRITGNASAMAQNAFIRLVEENKHRRDIFLSFSQGGDSYERLRDFNQEAALSMTVTSHYLSKENTIAKHGLKSELLATLPGCIRIGKGHRLYDAETVTVEDLSDDLFLDTPNSSVSNALLTSGILRLKQNHRISSMHHKIRKDLIQKGLAYEVNYYLPGQPNPEFREIPINNLSYKMAIVTNPMRPPIPELERFKELLKEELEAVGVPVGI